MSNSATVGHDAGIEEQVAAEQLRMVLTYTAVATLVATAFALFLGWEIRQGAIGSNVPTWQVDMWLQIKVAIAAARIWHSRLYWKRLAANPGASTDDRGWERTTLMLLLVDGAVWGAGAASLMSQNSELATFISATISVVAAIATFGLQVHFGATVAYVTPMVGAVVVGYLLRGDQVGYIGGIGVGIFLALMLTSARGSERKLKEMFRLRIVTEKVSMERQAALELAEQHSQAKDIFLAVVSHELRTPLHSMLGLTKLSKRDIPASNVLYHYHQDLTIEAGNHLLRMVDDLLNVTAMRSGKLDIQQQTFSLKREIDSFKESYGSKAHEVGIGFDIECVGDVLKPPVLGDAARVGQILHNLVGNAFKFSKLGARVDVRIWRDPGSEYVTFDVKDEGPGIAPAERARIFDLFSQGTMDVHSRPPGVGIGLWVARHLARAMGGDVTCTSEVGRGSTFRATIMLPVSSEKVRRSRVPASVLQRPEKLGIGRRVAVVDDDETNRLVCATAVVRMRAEYEEYAEATLFLKRSALKETGRPDVVMLDYNMPGLDGVSATRQIRAYEREHPELKPIQVIGLSADKSEKFMHAAHDAGMDCVLSKPCDPEQIQDAIATCIWRIENADRRDFEETSSLSALEGPGRGAEVL